MGAKIYKIINDINNKEYVGQTYLSIEKRFERHCNESKWKNTKKMPIVLAIKKYGKEHFRILLLEELNEDVSQKEVDLKEVEWGLKLNTISPNGYNLKLGGSGHGLWSEEVKKKIGDSNSNKFVSEETKKKLSKSHFGKRLSESTRKKMSEYWSGKSPSELARKNCILKNQKSYILISPDGVETEITNMAKFCRENGYDKGNMCELVRGKKKIYRGWKVTL